MKDRIKAIRKAAKMTQTEFGHAIGATRSMVASYEGGAVIPSDTLIELICMKFNISRLWLKTGEGPMEDLKSSDSSSPLDIILAIENIPERFKEQLKILLSMDPEWWAVLDKAFETYEAQKSKQAKATEDASRNE